jgi:hypothetical protein
VFPLLILSKRMHSIFMLRLFNDCFAVLGLFLAIFFYQRKQWHVGSFFYATGLNVKMSMLLPLPAIGILSLQAVGGREAITQAMIILQVCVSAGDILCKDSVNSFRWHTVIRSGSRLPRTLQRHLSSPDSSFTNGPSTGDSLMKGRFSPRSSRSAS